jgi:hypothetical protein
MSTHQASWNFTGLTSLPTSIIASDYTINYEAESPSAKYNHVLQSANVAVSGGYLQLKGLRRTNHESDQECRSITLCRKHPLRRDARHWNRGQFGRDYTQ